MIESILDSTKKALGIDAEYDVFDPEIIMHINSMFGILNQLGVGPDDQFMIEDKDATWSQFEEPNKNVMSSVRSWMYTRVRLLFDPPATSFGIQAMEKVASEIEWRLNVYAEGVNHG